MKSYTKILTMVSFALILAGSVSQTLFGQEQEKKETQSASKLSELSLEDLLNIPVTTASKQAESTSDAPGILSVLSKDDLERFGGTTLRDILERVPGLISSGANYTNRTTIAPRGDQIKQNSSHVLFLINGRPIRETQEGGVMSEFLESFPINIIEKIEVIKGPGSVLYGSDAFSAVINVITKKAEATGFSATGLAQNSGGYKTMGNLRYTGGDVSIVAAGNYFQKPKWNTPYHFLSNGKDSTVNLSIPNRGVGSYAEVDYKGLSLMTSYDQWKTDYIRSGADIVELTKFFANVGYKTEVNEKWYTDLNVTYTHSGLKASISERSSYNLVAEWTNTITLSDVSKLVVGGLFNRNDGQEKPPSTGVIISSGTINSFALYAQLDYRLIENLKLIGGLQANKVDKIDLNIVPRAGLIWTPAERFSVKALYSQAFRAASINEANMKFGTTFFGDPLLKPEYVTTVDFSIGYQGQQVQLAMNLFDSKMTDIIQIITNPVTRIRTYTNAANVTFMGVEFEGKYYIDRQWYLTGSVLYQTNKNDKDQKNLSPIANFGSKAGVSYESENGITVGLFDIYQGNLDAKFTTSRNPYQGSYNLLHFNSKFNLNKLFDMSLTPDLSVILNVDNLLGEKHFGYDLGGATGDGIPSIPGRAIYAGLNCSI